MQTKKKSAAEAVTNTVSGIVLNQVVLYLAGVPLSSAIGLTLVMMVVSTVRSYIVRRIFA
jgi:hypothetical protein